MHIVLVVLVDHNQGGVHEGGVDLRVAEVLQAVDDLVVVALLVRVLGP